MFRQLAFGSLPALLALSVAVPAYAQFDRVYVKGQINDGIIVEMGRDKVVLDKAGIKREFEVKEINQITYADEPTELANARSSVRARNYNAALTELRKLDGQPRISREFSR